MPRPWTLFLLCLALAACRSTGAKLVDAEERAQGLVSLRIEGNEKVGDGELKLLALGEMFALGQRRPSKALIDDVAYVLRLFYLNKGYRSAEVTYTIDAEESALSLKQSSAPVGVTFSIHEGQVTRLQGVEFLGEPSLHSEELRSFFRLEDEQNIYVRAEVDSGLRRLQAYYLELGFRDSAVSLQQVRFDESGSRAQLEVLIHEGPRYVLNQVTYGEVTPADVQAGELGQDLIGQPYKPRLGFRLRSQILDVFARRGFPRCEVSWEAQMDAESGQVGLRYAIEPGSEVRLSALTISGNKHTKGSSIRARVPLRAGDLYDAAKLQEGLRALYSTGLFESIRIELGEDDALNLAVKENPSLDLRVEPGWGSYEGPRLNVVLDERNFLGTARRVSLAAHVSPLASGSRLTYYEPKLFGGKTDASISIFGEQREEPTYSIEHVGFDLVFHRRLRRHINANLGYRFRFNELTDVDLQLQDPDEVDEPNAGILSLNASYDDRDDLLLPTRGTRARLQFELAEKALGSEVDFLRSHLGWSYIWELGPRDGLVFATRSALIHTLGSQDTLPLYERLYLGGENSVRSFGENDLGPLDAGGQPRGGEASSFLSMEWRRRLSGNFGGALFFDAGNLVEDVEDYLHFDDFRFAIGVGLRYSLPIGPLRVDLGYNPAARAVEDDFALHFSVGYSY